MRASRVVAGVGVALVGLGAAPLHGQGYRVRVDTRFQSVAFRGLTLDSIAAVDAVIGPTGGFESPDGFAVRCPVGTAFCTFFRPGPVRRGGPLVSTVDLTLWGLGIPGLQVRAKTRVGADLAAQDVWPGTEPAAQLLEGYVDYSARRFAVQVGRTSVFNRFGFTPFDGGRVEVRPWGRRLRVMAYGGWGLARGSALPVSSPDLNPLEDFQPPNRQLIGGAQLGWSSRRFDGGMAYQREVDPESDQFVSERLAFEGALRPLRGLSVFGGADYDLAFANWGTADGTVRYVDPDGRFDVSGGGRRYRPHFDLWNIWGVFSPTPYSAVFGTAGVRPIRGVELRGKGEAYRYDNTATATPLVRVDDDGWRWSVAASVTRLTDWSFNASYHAEGGPGGGSIGYEGAVRFTPNDVVDVTARAGRLLRPLEFRFDNSHLWSYGVRLDVRPVEGLRLSAETILYDETRLREDAAQFNWNQARVNLGASFVFGTGIRERGLHPAILRIPERRRSP